MHKLVNPVRHYAWGSSTRLAEFLGRPPSGEPEAELWLGAHPGDPSELTDGRRLDDVIAEDPDAALGPAVRNRFGDRLPFLMKVLAVQRPLSLQVHPSAELSRLGFEREQAGNAARDAPRNYQDPWPKPELIYALTRFEAMAGFRDVASSVALLRLLSLSWADALATRLESGPPSAALFDVVDHLLRRPRHELSTMLGELRAAAAGRRGDWLDDAGGEAERGATHIAEASRVLRRVSKLAQRHPDDAGVLIALLLNHVDLRPGQAMFVRPGVIHAYSSGFGIEIMGASDNVVRAGMTAKHVDADELLRVADFTPISRPRCAPHAFGADHVRFLPPVTEFSLTIGRSPFPGLPDAGPRVLLVLDGRVELTTGCNRQVLDRGESVFIGHSEGRVDVTGTGEVAIAAVPL